MFTNSRKTMPSPRRRLRGALAALLLGTTVLGGIAVSTVHQAVAADPTPVVDQRQAQAMPGSFAPLVKKVMPAVVTIMAEQAPPAHVRSPNQRGIPNLPDFRGTPFEDFFKHFNDQFGNQGDDQPQRGGTSLGSGFIIDSDGYIVTNNHVIDGASDITVTLEDNTRIPATLVGRDAKTDVALLKVKADKPLPHLDFGDSESAQVGDWVVAVGNPFGIGATVTTGIVSARNRNINAGPYDDFIQTDAAINRGNSGGPMFNTNGEVVGINTAIFSPTGASVGIGFAIPSNIAKTVVAELREHGKVERGWLGINIQSVTPELAESMTLKTAKGALIANVMPDSPAAKSGLHQGDVVLTFDGKPVDDARALSRLVAATRAGRDVDVVVQRAGQEQTIKVAIGKMKDDAKNATADDDQTSDKVAGLSLAPLDNATRQRLRLDEDVKGVLITDIDGRSPLRPGDVIVKVDDQSVTTPAEVQAQVRNAEKAGRKAVLLLVNRGGNETFVALKLDRS